jgi:hypothetical protein
MSFRTLPDLCTADVSPARLRQEISRTCACLAAVAAGYTSSRWPKNEIRLAKLEGFGDILRTPV